MALNQNKPLPPSAVDADEDAIIALKTMTDYKSSNPTFALQAVQAKHEAMQAAHEEEKNATDALKAKRDASVAAEWEFHNAILGAKNQVIAQFGENSDQVASLGLKKRQEYKRPTRKQTADAAVKHAA